MKLVATPFLPSNLGATNLLKMWCSAPPSLSFRFVACHSCRALGSHNH